MEHSPHIRLSFHLRGGKRALSHKTNSGADSEALCGRFPRRLRDRGAPSKMSWGRKGASGPRNVDPE